MFENLIVFPFFLQLRIFNSIEKDKVNVQKKGNVKGELRFIYLLRDPTLYRATKYHVCL